MQKIPFEDLPSTDTPIDATNLNTMQGYIEQAVNDKIGLITLLDASSTAPEECQIGDLYYNTDTSLIYEATGTNTWGSVGNTPNDDYLYLDKTNKAIYYYNGTGLDVFGAAVVDDLTSSSTVNPPSIDAVNSAISDISDSIDNINTEINSLKPVTLWTNPSPNNNFGSQSITLSSSDYSYLEIYYYEWGSDSVAWKDVQCVKTLKGYNTVLGALISFENKAFVGTRRMRYVDNTHLQVDNCYSLINESRFSTIVSNAWCVPLKILGYK